MTENKSLFDYKPLILNVFWINWMRIYWRNDVNTFKVCNAARAERDIAPHKSCRVPYTNNTKTFIDIYFQKWFLKKRGEIQEEASMGLPFFSMIYDADGCRGLCFVYIRGRRVLRVLCAPRGILRHRVVIIIIISIEPVGSDKRAQKSPLEKYIDVSLSLFRRRTHHPSCN